MPRQKFRQKYGKNYSHKGKKFSGNKVKKTTKPNEPVSKESKKFKFIRRNQETEEALRRQQQLEENYRERNAASILNADDTESDDDSSDGDNKGSTSFEQLMSTFHAAGSYGTTSNNVIESDESDSEDSANQSDTDKFDENVFTYEEQSQPRGPKYHSSEEEEENSENDSDDDDMPVDTSQSILRPEEFDNKGHFEDSIEDENEDSDESESELDGDEKDVDSEDENNANDSQADKFNLHLNYELSPELLECMNDAHLSNKEVLNWPTLGRIQVEIPTAGKGADSQSSVKKRKTLLDNDDVYAPEGTVPILYEKDNFDLEKAAIKVQLRPNVVAANRSNVKDNQEFTELQLEIFSIMNNYQDLFYPHRTHANGEEIRFMYTLHAVNHIMKTRTKVLNHNLKLKMIAMNDSKTAAIIPDKYRDQGLFRSKVLVVVPFRQAALQIVKILVSLLYPDGNKENTKSQVMHYKRFLDEYGGDTLHFPKKNPKPGNDFS